MFFNSSIFLKCENNTSINIFIIFQYFFKLLFELLLVISLSMLHYWVSTAVNLQSVYTEKLDKT